MPIHIHLLYGKAPLGAHQTCSWGFIKKHVSKADQARCSYCPLNPVGQGILRVQRKSNWVDSFRLELKYKATCRMMTQIMEIGVIIQAMQGWQWGGMRCCWPFLCALLSLLLERIQPLRQLTFFGMVCHSDLQWNMYYRIIEMFRLEGILNIIRFQQPCRDTFH